MRVRSIGQQPLIDVIAPASAFDTASFQASVAVLQAANIRLRFRSDISTRTGFLAGSDERRLEELLAALDAPDSDVIWAARGGYGVTRLLPQVPVERIRDAGKIVIGFSDVSALHARWLAAGLPSIHGSMVARFGQEPPDVQARLLSLLASGEAPAPLSGKGLVPGVAEGLLTGGNLMVLSALCGTPYQPDLQGCVLLLEEVGERPYRIDRLLVQCAQAGLFKGIAGIAVGEFKDCEQADGSATSAQVLAEHLPKLGVPVLTGLPVGHGVVNMAVPFGRRVRLDVDAGALTFLEPLFSSER